MKMLMVLTCVLLTGCRKLDCESLTISQCIQSHLSAMAGADHVREWDVELYREVVKSCREIYKKELE